MREPYQQLYFDYQSTTPVDSRVAAAMRRHADMEQTGNPHADHDAGRRNALAIQKARAQIAMLVGAAPEEIIFTSGATEANNIAIQGIARALQTTTRRRLITAATEHKSVLEPMAYLAGLGFDIEVLPVDSNGFVALDELKRCVEGAALVSIMIANNEIGVIQPMTEIAEICRKAGALFHTDAAQAVGKLSVDFSAWGVDLASISGHKLYGPEGIGALFVSRESAVRPLPLTFGGGQEGGLRPGTLPTSLCVGLGEACSIATHELPAESERLRKLAMLFLARMTAGGDVRLVGDPTRRIPGNLSLRLAGAAADHIVAAVQPHLAISTGSACNVGQLDPSHVLTALGMSRNDAAETVRVGFGRFTTEKQVVRASDLLLSAWQRAQEIGSI
jgi:cysteine desulfurase